MILDHVDSGHVALPEFQRGYVWKRKQVRELFDSLYRRHPIGYLLVWAVESEAATYRGDVPPAAGIVKLLLDGQQRMTSLYGVVRGQSPNFFIGDANAFTNLRFNIDSETFAFYQPQKMKGNPLWINVTELMKGGTKNLGELVSQLSQEPASKPKVGEYMSRLTRLFGIIEVDLHVEEVTDKDPNVVVDIFNRVNSSGTKLSKGDLALAKICSDWPAARESMRTMIRKWGKAGYSFTLDWLLRSVNTILTGKAMFHFLHDKSAEDIQSALKRAGRQIDKCLNLIGGRLGLDHDRVFFSRLAVPVIVRYLEKHDDALSEQERDKLLFWYVQTGIRGRFSASTESKIDQDLAQILGDDDDLDRLLDQLRLSHGSLRVEPEHFKGSSMGAQYYPVLYLLTRMGESRDWGTGLPLKAGLIGKMNQLEKHHIFPKAQLKTKYGKADVNAIANFCFLTKETNIEIRDSRPQDYFYKVEDKYPGALASHWIPMDEKLWEIGHYLDFLEERRTLLAKEANRQFAELLHDDTRWIRDYEPTDHAPSSVPGDVPSENEEKELEAINDWVEKQGFPKGILAYEHSDPDTGEQQAILDLAWPNGIQEELSQPVALLLNEPAETISRASSAGFRCFTSLKDFKCYVEREILMESET